MTEIVRALDNPPLPLNGDNFGRSYTRDSSSIKKANLYPTIGVKIFEMKEFQRRSMLFNSIILRDVVMTYFL